jgi:hypothetical protein
MVYQNKFIAVIKCNNKILREINKNEVILPFGSEYSILFKNLESRRVSVKISIDGTDILYGDSLVIDANSELELERFLERLDSGNKLKFIQKTQKISNHRGDKIDDGIIRIEYAFEQYVVSNWITYSYPDYSCPPVEPRIFYSGGVTGGTLLNSSVSNNVSFVDTQQVSEDPGITVPGSVSHQSFGTTTLGTLEQSEVIVLVLRGTTLSGNVSKPLTTKTKLECPTCGTKHKSSVKFCSDCGTGLII